MTKKKKKDIFQFNPEDAVDFDLINSRLEKNENLLKKQEVVSNSHLQLFEETLSSLSNDYEQIQKLKKEIRFLYWSVYCVGFVTLSILIFLLYFILSFMF